MPAIDPARLRKQAAQVATHYHRPSVFLRELEAFFEFYADRTRRPGQVSTPPPLIPAHHIPAPALRQVIQALVRAAADAPQEALTLADTLWAEPILECKLIAAQLLNKISGAEAASIHTRVVQWAQTAEEDQLLDALFAASISRLDEGAAPILLPQIKSWLLTNTLSAQILGLRALAALAHAPTYQNIPHLFQLLVPLINEAPADILPFVRDAINALAQRTPEETAYFLEQSLRTGKHADISWLIRQVMPRFSPAAQARLRTALHQK